MQTFNYSYDLSTDRLLTYNGKTCSYDSNGNPTNYLGNTTTFNKENKLASFKKQGEANATTFTYDAEGLRKTKTTASGVTKQYNYFNGTLYREQYVQNGVSRDLRFIYTVSGITGFILNEEKFIYLKNTLGDIVGIFNASGNLLCRYVYDAWGNHKVLNASGVENTSATFIGNINPIRYRGYYYDADLGLYYLKSRYYDSEVGRFISIDKLDYLAPETINGLNLYAYCLNNPILFFDPFGKEAEISVNFTFFSVLSVSGCILKSGQYIPKRKFITTSSYGSISKFFSTHWNNFLYFGEQFLAHSELYLIKYNVDILKATPSSFTLIDASIKLVDAHVNFNDEEYIGISLGSANAGVVFDFEQSKFSLEAQATLITIGAYSENINAEILIGSIGGSIKLDNGRLKISFSYGVGFSLDIKLF